MKNFIFFTMLLVFSFSQAQNTFIVHTATVDNISFSASFIDHPDLNNNPSAKIIAVHNWNPPGSTGVYNQSPTGVYYEEGAVNKWAVFNENETNMLEGTSYNVYIANDAAVTHSHNGDAIHADPIYSIVNHPDLNGDPDAIAVMTTYWNPFDVWNNANYGFWYDDVSGEWIIYNEGLNPIPANASYFIAGENPSVASMRHVATAANISLNWTNIDHPLLNNDPDAIFVFSHNWGVSGEPSNVLLDKTLGAWYTGDNWAIYTEDQSAMPVNATFDILIYDPSLSLSENNSLAVTLYPNPVVDYLTVEASEIISAVTIYNTLGQVVETVDIEETKKSMDISHLTSGIYYATVKVGEAQQTLKIIKK